MVTFLIPMFGFCCGFVVVLLWLLRLNWNITPYRLVQTEAHLAESPKRDTNFEKKIAHNFSKIVHSTIVLIAFLSKINDIEMYLRKKKFQNFRNSSCTTDFSNDIATLMESLEENNVYRIQKGRVLEDDQAVKDHVVGTGLQILMEGEKNPLSEYN
jgi:hypothetical protein